MESNKDNIQYTITSTNLDFVGLCSYLGFKREITVRGRSAEYKITSHNGYDLELLWNQFKTDKLQLDEPLQPKLYLYHRERIRTEVDDKIKSHSKEVK